MEGKREVQGVLSMVYHSPCPPLFMGEWALAKNPRKGIQEYAHRNSVRHEKGGWFKKGGSNFFCLRKGILLMNTDFMNAFPKRQFEANR